MRGGVQDSSDILFEVSVAKKLFATRGIKHLSIYNLCIAKNLSLAYFKDLDEGGQRLFTEIQN